MSEIRGEKVVFRKEDIVCLHELPSAQAHEPIVLHAMDGRSKTGLVCRIFAGLGAVALFVILSIVAVVESGLADGPLNARAVAALNQALGPAYSASVEHTVLRFSSWGGLALKAENVELDEVASGQELAKTASISLKLDPVALISGRIAIERLDVEGAAFNPALLPKGGPLNLAAARVSDVPDYMDAFFGHLDGISRIIADSGMRTVRISDFGTSLPGAGGRTVTVAVETLEFDRARDGSMAIAGRFSVDGRAGEIDLTASGADGALERVDGTLKDVALGAFLVNKSSDGAPRSGLDTVADIAISTVRGGEGAPPRLAFSVSAAGGSLYADGIPAEIKSSNVSASYNFDRGSIEFSPSRVDIGASSFPFTGGIIDLDRISGETTKGFAIDLLLNGGTSAPLDTGEAPIRFDAKASGRFLPETGELLFTELGLSSERGALAGSLALNFNAGDGSPQISFVAIADKLQSEAVKQFWPYWMGKNARRWVISNIFGGTVTNGRIEVFLPAGRLPEDGGRLEPGKDELKISFDIAGARMNVAGEIPPLRDTSGRFELNGERADITIASGTAYFTSGRSVTLTGGTFVLPDTYERPLMAEMDINVAGNADAIAELVTYRPIRALQRTGFKPEDFTGSVKANVKARLGLILNQNPPPPEWVADMTLSDVDVNKPISGRGITSLDGSLKITPVRADLDAKAEVDGVPMQISMVEPIDGAAGVTRETKISASLGNDARRKLLPGFDDILDGTVSVEIDNLGEGRQKIVADLGRTAVSIPWIGWTKGAGIGGKAEFLAVTANGETRISDFSFSGDGFEVNGNLVFNGSSLNSANFSRVKLSAADSYRLSVGRDRSGYMITVNGETADVRSILGKLKSGSGTSGAGTGKERDGATIRADLTRMIGFNGETLGNVSLRYSISGQRIRAADFSGVTASGAPVVAKLANGDAADVIEFTSGDAGAIARFADIYRHMNGGLLNVRMRASGDDGWRGSVDVRRFSLVGEDKLRSIVSTPAGQDGRSLNQAVRRDIDTSSMHFDRGFARVRSGGGILQIDNGVVRGESVGATFQGTVRDARGNMDMTGTFMPAYGLNRLFAELPLIGVILGNGRDRGLLGITFKLTGQFDKPQLTINPLSIIAPGVFRNIFEFQ
ncbi:MAG: AsmA-like C-terminal region-containing protein [Shinella sp.]|nr:AsmA-like C-terminal region-containing protein [Shinella sp.]